MVNLFEIFEDNIYCAPEMLKNREQNRRRRMDQNWVQQSIARRQVKMQGRWELEFFDQFINFPSTN